jgi:hypothetical protein
MPDLRVISPHVGDVLVSQELVELLGEDTIHSAVSQLRVGGGHCPACKSRLHHVEDVSLVVHETAAGGSVGFIHMRCGPSHPGLYDGPLEFRRCVRRGIVAPRCSIDVVARRSSSRRRATRL